MSHLRKIVAACAATAALAGAANAQPIVWGEGYQALFMGPDLGPFAQTSLVFDGVASTMTGQPTHWAGSPIGDPVSYQITETQFANGDGTWTVRIEVFADGGFFAPGLDSDPWSGGVQPLRAVTFDLGATTYSINDGLHGADDSVLFLSANITWAAGDTILSSVDATQRIALRIEPGTSFSRGGGLRGQFTYTDPTDIGASGLDRMTLDIIVTPAPGAVGVLAAGGLFASRRRR